MDYNVGLIILSLRKAKGITQEELAQKLNISSQAVSKWENGACLPDTQMLPILAKYFNVSIDYLFNGDSSIKDKNINEAACDYVASFGQFKGYSQALELLAYAHSGLSGTPEHIENVRKCISYISDSHGLSLLGLKQGYGVILTREMFEHISPETLDFVEPFLNAFADKDKAMIIMAVISMDSASFGELMEMMGWNGEKLRSVLDSLINCKIVFEEKSKHKQLGTIYHIDGMRYPGICVLLATFEIMRQSMRGITCYSGYGDYPVKYKV